MSQYLYIPVSGQSLADVLNAGPSFKSVLEDICLDEILGFCALQELPGYLSPSKDPDVFERMLAKLFDIGREVSEKGQQSLFKQRLISNIDYDKLKAGAKEMYRLGVKLISTEAVQERAYLNNEGEWDFEFSKNYTSWIYTNDNFTKTNDSPFLLTEEQSRIASLVATEMGEHLHLQGYAGTGKTYLIRALLHLLESRGVEPKAVLILAHTQNQLGGLSPQLRAKHVCRTFGDLARSILPRDYHRLKNSPVTNYYLTRNELAKHLALGKIGGFTGEQLANIVHFTLKYYCLSADDEVSARHIPKWANLNSNRNKKESSAMSELVIAKAKYFWSKILNPTSEFIPPVRTYHQIKLAAMLGVTAPSGFSHVIVDEAHDLSPAMLQILDASPQCCLSFGDCYQNLQGIINRRSTATRERLITHSFRTGGPLAEVINPVINAHPFGPKDLFHGSSEVPAIVDYYKKAEIPDKPAAIIVSDEWALWEWIQRMSSENLNYKSISSLSSLDLFVTDVLKLKENGRKPSHGVLTNFRSWDSLVKHYKQNISFKNIFKMLDRGYTERDWSVAKSRHAENRENLYILAKAEDSRNQEFDRLMLTPDVIDMVSGEGKRGLAKPHSALYVAITRAKHVLIAPISLRHWIEEISGR